MQATDTYILEDYKWYLIATVMLVKLGFVTYNLKIVCIVFAKVSYTDFGGIFCDKIHLWVTCRTHFKGDS